MNRHGTFLGVKCLGDQVILEDFIELLQNLCGPCKRVDYHKLSRLFNATAFSFPNTLISKRQVRQHEANFLHMSSIVDIIPCMKSLRNTETRVLTSEDICKNDEKIVKPVGESFIKRYHHFTYPAPGVVNCRYVKGKGDYFKHEMRQEGMKSCKEYCGICGDEDDPINDKGRTWIECETCNQWFHCDCLQVDEDIIEDEFKFTFHCDECINCV